MDKVDIKEYEVANYYDTTFKFLDKLLEAMKATHELLIKGQLRMDSFVQIPEFINEFNIMNWSYKVKPFEV